MLKYFCRESGATKMSKECPFVQGQILVQGKLDSGRPYEISDLRDRTPSVPKNIKKCLFERTVENYAVWPYDENDPPVELNYSMICVVCERHLYFKFKGKPQATRKSKACLYWL